MLYDVPLGRNAKGKVCLCLLQTLFFPASFDGQLLKYVDTESWYRGTD